MDERDILVLQLLHVAHDFRLRMMSVEGRVCQERGRALERRAQQAPVQVRGGGKRFSDLKMTEI